MSTKEPALLVDGLYGIYVPQRFVRRFDPAAWGVSAEDAAILEAGPDHPEYWGAWDSVLWSAEHTDADGARWILSQDGDLRAIPADYEEVV